MEAAQREDGCQADQREGVHIRKQLTKNVWKVCKEEEEEKARRKDNRTICFLQTSITTHHGRRFAIAFQRQNDVVTIVITFFVLDLTVLVAVILIIAHGIWYKAAAASYHGHLAIGQEVVGWPAGAQTTV